MVFEIAAGIVLAVLALRHWRLLLWLILAAVDLWLVAALAIYVWGHFGDLATGAAILMAFLGAMAAVMRLFGIGSFGQIVGYAALMAVIGLFSAGTSLLKADFQGTALMAGIAFTITAGLLGLAAWHRHRRPSARRPAEGERPADRIEPHF